ncbi:MAG TPA: HAD family hydrolase [Gemmatimonadaceae bacterium]|nr:HAD family hydrolase [Gemmatimonadaceae bacterium]
MSAAARPAVFLDRDGTIIVDSGYVSRPEDVVLITGAARAIARLNAAGIPVVVVSNQSGIGRGYFGEDDYERVRARLERALAAAGAHVDATLICPHAPLVACECRKPGTLLFRRAADQLALDLARSWYIGDRWRDVSPALALGGHPLLVPAPSTPEEDLARAKELGVAVESLGEAVNKVIGHRG